MKKIPKSVNKWIIEMGPIFKLCGEWGHLTVDTGPGIDLRARATVSLLSAITQDRPIHNSVNLMNINWHKNLKDWIPNDEEMTLSEYIIGLYLIYHVEAGYLQLTDARKVYGSIMSRLGDKRYKSVVQQVDSAEASTIAVPPSDPSGSPR